MATDIDLASSKRQISSEHHLVLEAKVAPLLDVSAVLDLEALDKIERDMVALKEMLEQMDSLVVEQNPKVIALKIETIDLSAGKMVNDLEHAHRGAWRCDIL